MEALRLQPLGRTTAVFSMILGFILAQTLCPQRHSKVCLELLKTFRVTLESTYLSGGNFSKVEYLDQPIGSEEMRKFYCSDCTSFLSKASLL